VDVTVTTPSGTSSTGSADHFSFAADAALSPASGTNFNATAGGPFVGQVASFTDTDAHGSASQFTAYIGWGNGQFSLGGILGTFPNLHVQGGVTYGTAGTYTVTVLIQDVGGASALVTATATVSNPPGAPSQPGPQAAGTTATATHGTPFTGSVATFTGSVPGGSAANYTVTIAWGNGTTTAGAVRPTGANTFSVDGTNTYAAAGTYTVSVTITDSAGNSTTVDTTLTVADAGPVPPDEEPELDAPGQPRRPEPPALLASRAAEEEDADRLDGPDAAGWTLDVLAPRLEVRPPEGPRPVEEAAAAPAAEERPAAARRAPIVVLLCESAPPRQARAAAPARKPVEEADETPAGDDGMWVGAEAEAPLLDWSALAAVLDDLFAGWQG
jgi:hypothetical protein